MKILPVGEVPKFPQLSYQDPGRSFALSLARTLEHQGLRNSPDTQKLPMICWCHEWEASPKKMSCLRMFSQGCSQDMPKYVEIWHVKICQNMSKWFKMLIFENSHILLQVEEPWIPTCAEVSNSDARSMLGASCVMLAPVFSLAAAHLMGFRYEDINLEIS